MDMDTVPSPAKLLEDATKAMEGLRPVAVYRPLPTVFDGSTLNILGYSAAKGADNGASSPAVSVDVVAPSVSFSVSSPNMLPRPFRKDAAKVLWLLTAVALVASAIVAMSVDGAAGATAAVSLAILAITTITLSYFVIMGFGKVDYSAGLQGAAKEKEEDPEKEEEKNKDDKTKQPGQDLKAGEHPDAPVDDSAKAEHPPKS